VPRLPWWGGAALAVALLGIAAWTFRARGADAGSAAALWPPLHVLIVLTGSLASPLLPLAAGWITVFGRHARRLTAPAAVLVALVVLAGDWLDDGLPAWTMVAGWLLLAAVAAGLTLASTREPRRARTTPPAPPAEPAHPAGQGEVAEAEVLLSALHMVLRATDADEAALWRADAGAQPPTAACVARLALEGTPPGEASVPLAGHPFNWAIEEKLPQRLERGRRTLPSPWAEEMLLLPVDAPDGVLALAYPGPVPPGADVAAVHAGRHLSALLGLLRARGALERAEAGMRALAQAVRTLPGEVELDGFARQLAAAVRQGTGAGGAAVALVTDDLGRGKLLHASGEPQPLGAESFGEADSRLALAVKHGVELSWPDLRREGDRLPLLAPGERWSEAPRSAAVLPLLVDGRAIGVVAAWHVEPGAFGEREMDILRRLCSVAPMPMRSARRMEALDQRASTDPLTGLPNRSVFDARLAGIIGVFDRYSRPFSVVALDVDHFKRVNDTYGHETGDRVLRHVAELIRQTVREVDLPARIGGEEFVVLLPETPLRQAAEAAERLRCVLETRPLVVNGSPLPVTASLGVAACPDTPNPADVLAAADAALYRAKDGGRNRVETA